MKIIYLCMFCGLVGTVSSTHKIASESLVQVVRSSSQDGEHPYSLQDLITVTEYIRQYITFKVPAYTLTKDCMHVCYPRIEGVTLTQERLVLLEESKVDRLAKELALFIYQMQKIPPIPQILNEHEFLVAEGHLKRVPLPEELDRMLRPIFDEYPDLKDLRELWLKIYPLYVKASSKACYFGIVHNDLHGGNILINESTGEVSGIIDWDLVANGNILREMRFFYSLSLGFMEKVASNYCKIAGIQDEVEFIKLVYVFRAYRDFNNLVKSIKFPSTASDSDHNSDHYLRDIYGILNSRFTCADTAIACCSND